jgi:uncharacterized protein
MVGDMWREPERDCWLHPDVEVRRSPIACDGLFARAPIASGTEVSRLGGRLVTGAELAELFAVAARHPNPPYIDSITVADDLHLVLPRGNPNGKGNHSCDPNLWWSGAYTLVTRRDIAADEELTNDYATSTASAEFVMACRCGAVDCRGTITGQDWRRADLRQAYGDHWVPALLRRIRGGA